MTVLVEGGRSGFRSVGFAGNLVFLLGFGRSLCSGIGVLGAVSLFCVFSYVLYERVELRNYMKKIDYRMKYH